MKKFIWLALLLPIVGWTNPAESVASLPACLTEQWLDDMMDFAQARDQASWDAYVEMEKCVILRKGLVVTVTSRGLIKTEFVYQGTKFWTPREALRVY